MSTRERSEYLFERTLIYHVRPSSLQTVTREDSPRRLSDRIDASLRKATEWVHEQEGLRAESGLPIDLSELSLVIVHVHGGFSGMFPGWPRLNRFVCGANMDAIVDVTARYSHLRLPAPVIAFRLPTETQSMINFGQEDDALSISNVLNAIVKRASSIKIVLSGDCLGALRILRWQQHTKNSLAIPNQVKGFLLVSPIDNMRRVFQLPFLPHDSRVNRGLYQGMRAVLPNFRLEPSLQVACTLPALVLILENDDLSGLKEREQIQKWLQNSIVMVAPIGATDGRSKSIHHGSVYRWPPFTNAATYFIESLTKTLSARDRKN